MKATLALHRAYFVVVLGFTGWVGSFGFFWPLEIQRALPWPVPPLHARIIGAAYLAASVFLLLAALARSRLQVRTVVDMAAVWTGWLLLISLLHWRSFDPARVQVWFWAGAYLSFPLAAWWLKQASAPVVVPGSALIDPRWALVWLGAQGLGLLLLGLLLTAAPAWIAGFWPWKISAFMAQIYAGPVLGLAVGSLLLARRRNWPETLFPTLGIAVFAALALLASAWHIGLFSAGSVSKIIWFSTLGLIEAMSLGLIVGALSHRLAARGRAPKITLERT